MIRVANKFDIPRLRKMLLNYQASGAIKNLKITNEETGLRILSTIIVGGGIGLVSEKNGVVTGMLLAVCVPFLWDNSQLIMSEVAYWVEPEYRNSTAGYRLLKKYTEMCEDLRDSGRIVNYTVSQLAGQELDYSRFGFKPIEQTWSI